jgi:hypothetical protein
LKVLRVSMIVSLFFFFLASARCEVSVSGTAEAVRIEAKQAPLSEVLRALGTNFKVRHDTFITVEEMIISGTYSGALEDVLRQMLSGLNYVIKTHAGTLEIIIVGRSSNTHPEPPASHTSPGPPVWDPLGVLKAKR